MFESTLNNKYEKKTHIEHIWMTGEKDKQRQASNFQWKLTDITEKPDRDKQQTITIIYNLMTDF